jgi:hypothetical protein
MLKSLIVTFALGAFAMSGSASQAQAEFKPCVNSTKDSVPCFATSQKLQLAKPTGKHK